jgi:hypothetical protein
MQAWECEVGSGEEKRWQVAKLPCLIIKENYLNKLLSHLNLSTGALNFHSDLIRQSSALLY